MKGAEVLTLGLFQKRLKALLVEFLPITHIIGNIVTDSPSFGRASVVKVSEGVFQRDNPELLRMEVPGGGRFQRDRRGPDPSDVFEPSLDLFA